jgi:hypothetical protein
MLGISWKNQKAQCDSFLSVVIMAWQQISSEIIVKGFKECYLSKAVNGTDMLWNDSEVGNVGTGVNMNTLETVKVQRVTLSSKGEWSPTCSVY